VISLGKAGALSARVGAAAELHHLGMNPKAPLPHDLWRLRRIIRECRPDVLHGWMYHGNIAATLANVGLGTPLVCGIHHSLYDLRGEKPLTRLMIKSGAFLSRHAQCMLYCSAVSSSQHEVLGYERARAKVIPNGFDIDMLRPDSHGRAKIRTELSVSAHEFLIGMVARVHPIKDHANFLRAARRFADTNPEARFVLVGDGAVSENASLSDLIASLSLGDRVLLCGRRTDIGHINAALDIATSSSRGEAFPMTLGEAMACGVPCVATDVGDVSEIIGDTGVVVPPRDADALAAGWSQIAALDNAARQALGQRARQRIIDRFSMTAVHGRYMDLYASLADK